MQEQTFQLLLNGVPYVVKASPFEYNEETRFTVSFNGSEDFTFVYDTSVGRYMALDDDETTIPVDLEDAISERLYAMA